MSQPILKVDDEREIVFEAPRLGPIMVLIFLVAMMFGAAALFPSRTLALGIFGVLSLWALSGALRVHRLRLDLANRTWDFRHGWFFSTPLRRGTFDDILGVLLEKNEFSGGHQLRSRVLLLEMRGWPEGDGVFPLGFPMGPRVAVDKARDYARRLEVPLIDRTAL